MTKRLLAAALAVAVFVVSGCDQLTGLGEEEDLLGLSCSERDTTLVGLWLADHYDWGEGDVIAQGWSLEVEMREDGAGRLVETKPVASDTTPTTTAPDTAMVSDSAHFAWAACDGQLAVVFGEAFYSTENAEFTDSRFDYSFDGTTLSLSDSETGASITLHTAGPTSTNGLDPALFGTWTAVSIVATDPGGQHDPVELTSDGWALEITLNSDGTYSSTSVEAGGEPVNDAGRYTTHEGALTLDNGPNLYYEVADGQVTVTDSEGDAAYDFDGNGTDDPAVFVYTFAPAG